jgi:predicted Rossmann fold nucleotide-binding protein DprA/Smf involved in DNA uptake
MAALPVPRVLAELSALELKGLVVRCEGGYIRS